MPSTLPTGFCWKVGCFGDVTSQDFHHICCRSSRILARVRRLRWQRCHHVAIFRFATETSTMPWRHFAHFRLRLGRNQATSLMTQLRYFGIDVAGAGLQRPRVTASSRVGAFWRCWALHALPLSKPVPWQGSPGAGIFSFMLIMPYSAGRFCRSRPVCSRSHSRLSSTSRIRAARSLWLIGFCSTSRFGSSRP